MDVAWPSEVQLNEKESDLENKGKAPVENSKDARNSSLEAWSFIAMVLDRIFFTICLTLVLCATVFLIVQAV